MSDRRVVPRSDPATVYRITYYSITLHTRAVNTVANGNDYNVIMVHGRLFPAVRGRDGDVSRVLISRRVSRGRPRNNANHQNDSRTGGVLFTTGTV